MLGRSASKPFLITAIAVKEYLGQNNRKQDLQVSQMELYSVTDVDNPCFSLKGFLSQNIGGFFLYVVFSGKGKY